ncbi:hypothetical protein L9F63_015193 [Diploptera punctata]|uniref:Gustatory receptor n=1 Tax=Diploptera punctata TaxID=6984 RepID=A0AAD8EKU1_DIPPU|nr:hypothetical protein L9F63_015193 [Diploptera punctata]
MEKFIKFLDLSAFKRLMNTKDVYSATKPLYYLSKLLGLAPFSYNKNENHKAARRLHISTLGTLHSWGMCLLISNFLIFLFISNVKKEFPKLIIDIVNISDSYFSSLTVIVSYALCATVNRNKVIKLFQLLNKIDQCLGNTSTSFRITGASLLLGVSIYLIAHGIGYLVVIVFIPAEAKDYHIQFVYFSIYVVGAVTIMQFVYSVLLLKDRFEMLNRELIVLFEINDEETLNEKLLNFCQIYSLENKFEQPVMNKVNANKCIKEEKSNRLENDYKGKKYKCVGSRKKERIHRLKTLRGIHNTLCDAAELTNSTYQVQVLMDLIGILVEITTCLYLALTYAAQILTCRPTNAPRWNLLGLYVVWVTLNLSKLLAITISCRSACRNANYTAVLVHKLMILQPADYAAELQIFSQQLLHRKLCFTACGFFLIDFCLMYNMASSVTTYLIILLQYTGHDIGEDRIFELCNSTSQTTV